MIAGRTKPRAIPSWGEAGLIMMMDNGDHHGDQHGDHHRDHHGDHHGDHHDACDHRSHQSMTSMTKIDVST